MEMDARSTSGRGRIRIKPSEIATERGRVGSLRGVSAESARNLLEFLGSTTDSWAIFRLGEYIEFLKENSRLRNNVFAGLRVLRIVHVDEYAEDGKSGAKGNPNLPHIVRWPNGNCEITEIFLLDVTAGHEEK